MNSKKNVQQKQRVASMELKKDIILLERSLNYRLFIPFSKLLDVVGIIRKLTLMYITLPPTLYGECQNVKLKNVYGNGT